MEPQRNLAMERPVDVAVVEAAILDQELKEFEYGSYSRPVPLKRLFVDETEDGMPPLKKPLLRRSLRRTFD